MRFLVLAWSAILFCIVPTAAEAQSAGETVVLLLEHYGIDSMGVIDRLDSEETKVALDGCQTGGSAEARTVTCDTEYPTSDHEVCMAISVVLPVSVLAGVDGEFGSYDVSVRCDGIRAHFASTPPPSLTLYRRSDGEILYRKLGTQ